LLDGFDSLGVQIQELLKGGILRSAVLANAILGVSDFKVTDASIRDAASVIDLLKREACPLSKLFKTLASVRFHPEYRNTKP
jgi:hypothetical protein